MGGTPGRLVKWYRDIDKTKYEVRILLSGPCHVCLRSLQAEYRTRDMQVDVIPNLGLELAFSPATRRELLAYFDEVKPDIIHSIFIQSDLIAAWYKKRSGVCSLVSSIEGALYPRRGLKAMVYRLSYFLLRKRLDRVIVLCRYMRDQAVGQYGVLSNRCQVIPSAIDTSLFRYTKHITPTNEQITIGFLGEIVRAKCIDLFVDTIPRLLERSPNLRFVIGGVGADLPRIVAKVEAMGLSRNVEFRGYVRDVPAFFGEIDVYAFLSVAEGLPWVILESQAAGVPTIASPVGGVPEVITDGSNGMLLRENSVEELCERVHTLVADAGLRETFSRNARQLMEQRFRTPIEVRQIESIYDEEMSRFADRAEA